MMGCGVVIKLILIILNILFALFAIAVIGLSIFLIVLIIGNGSASDLIGPKVSLLEVGLAVTIGFGLLLGIIAGLGIIAACTETRGLLALYLTMIVIVVILELTAGVLVVVFKMEVEGIEEDLSDTAVQLLRADKYYNNITIGSTTPLGTTFEFLQKQFDCCGVQYPDDYKGSNLTSTNRELIPYTCCALYSDASLFRKITYDDVLDRRACLDDYELGPDRLVDSDVPNSDMHLHTEGCFNKFMEFLTQGPGLKAAIGLVFAFLALEICAFIMACLMCVGRPKTVDDD